MTYALEKRGYVKAGVWTPEATVEHPEAGQLSSVKICCASYLKKTIIKCPS